MTISLWSLAGNTGTPRVVNATTAGNQTVLQLFHERGRVDGFGALAQLEMNLGLVDLA